MFMTKRLVILCVIFLVTGQSASAGVLSEMLKAAGRAAFKKGTGEAVEQGVKSAATRSARQLTSELAEANSRRLATRAVLGLGDDAARAIASGSGNALRLADDVAEATGKLSAQSSRRLLMMSDSIEATGQAPQLISALAKNASADQIVDFLWRNKAAIAGGTLLTTVIANPEAAMAAGSTVANSMLHASGEYIAKPAIEGTLQHVVAPATGGSAMGVWLFIGTGLLGLGGIVSIWVKTARARRVASYAAIVANRKT